MTGKPFQDEITIQLHHGGKALRLQATVGRGGFYFNRRIHLNPNSRRETPTPLIEFMSKASQFKSTPGKMLKEKRKEKGF